MKNQLPLKAVLICLCLGFINTYGQITITSADMPVAGDTMRVSEAVYPLNGIPDPANTGIDFSWDYSGLSPVSQKVLSFVSPSQTPFIYQFVFTPNVSNLAMPIQGLDFLDIEVTDAFEFYKNSSAEFVRAGFAASISGIPVPMKFDIPERIYKFPLSLTSLPDSSTSQVEVQYPGLAFFSLYRERQNYADGSGTLLTPFGTFNTLRVKSVIYERDSLYIDSLQVGMPVIRNIIEYKWLSPDYPVPLLTISQEGMFYSVQYADSVRNIVPYTVDLGPDITICQGDSVTLTPDVDGGLAPYTYIWSTSDTTSSITIAPQETTTYLVTVIDINGNFVMDNIQVVVIPFDRIELGNDTTLCAEHSLTFTVDGEYDNITWYINDIQKSTGNSFSIDSTGIGLETVILSVEFSQGSCEGSDDLEITFHVCGGFGESAPVKIALAPNPANDEVTVFLKDAVADPSIALYTQNGVIVHTGYKWTGNRLILDIKPLTKGLYFLKIITDGQTYTGKFIKN